ncbi:oligomeric Golgi complex component [Heterostelium album PN500]|uniref:Conserved oligomeric Golgi complex subunit 7 n=1 Tax=Heterostelium pallidum (strain ATCC 26659 / Pp 5 / PN500) TaxID=670386 RepID=D3AWI1_HETP5|nr:oligomeric Golgi complex component [Heterostelium album PN500]EFA86654.1 oligomeric Golgi complex component [Heterostelium album PN500]|eukprot:XP_020438759.1 oligomeric Golgi complex component [Heterostelium album PN500]
MMSSSSSGHQQQIDFDGIFSSDTFNTKQWINNLLKPANSTSSQSQTNDVFNYSIESDLEVHINRASDILSKLQIYSLELNMSLENKASDSLLYVPKAVREIDRVRKESVSLKQKVKHINQTIASMHANTSDTVARISSLDTVRKRIDQCIISLNEAEKLLSFSSGLDKLFQSADYLKIADTLEGVKQSLAVLSDIPEFREQQRHFQAHQDRLESLVRPQLIGALQSRDLESCVNYLKIFQSIKREQQFLIHYYNVRLEPIKALWSSYAGGSSKSPAGSATSPGTTSPPQQQQQQLIVPNLNQWCQGFYDEVILLANQEMDWLSKLSPGNYRQLAEQLLVNLFLSINSQFQTRIEQYAAPNQPGKTNELINLYKTTIQFLRTLDIPEKETLIKTVLEPFKIFQTKFPENESKLFKQYLSSFSLVKKNDFSTTIKNIENSINKIFPLCESSIDRFYSLTHVTEVEPFINVINNVFKDFVAMLKDSINELKIMSNISITKDILSQIEQRKQPANVKQQSQQQQHQQQQQQNWEYFQGAMKLLQDCNTFIAKMKHQATNKRSLFHDAQDQIQNYCAHCQHFVFETMINFIRLKLKDLPRLPEWKQQSGTESYQTNPSQVSYITQIAEHLLNIPQQLDPYSEEELIRFSYRIALSQPIANDDFYQNLVRQLYKSEQTTSAATISEDEEEEEEDGIAHQWMSLVAKATEKLYLQSIVEISTLTDSGCQQLANDISYLFNILSAIGVPHDPLLSLTQQLISIPKDKYLESIANYESSEKNISNLISKMRGIK